MPHSDKTLITLHGETTDGRTIDPKGLLCPLEVPILMNTGPKVWQTIEVGKAWRFFPGGRGVEAEIYLNEDLIPIKDRGRELFPGVDLHVNAINGDRSGKVIVSSQLQAIYLDLASPWEGMPAMYWPIRFPTGTAQVPAADSDAASEWMPGQWTP